MIWYSLVLFIGGVYSLIVRWKHILRILLSLELIILGIFLFLLTFIISNSIEVIVFYLIVVICEARLGLSVIIIRVYYYGRDFLVRYSMLRC